MKKLAIIAIVLAALVVALSVDPNVEAKSWNRVVVFDSLDVSAQTGDVTVEITAYDGRGALVGGVIRYHDYTFTTTGGSVGFYVTQTTNSNGDDLVFYPSMTVTGAIESDNDVDLATTDADKLFELGNYPSITGNQVTASYMFGQKLYCLYDHNGGDTGYITVILYIKDD